MKYNPLAAINGLILCAGRMVGLCMVALCLCIWCGPAAAQEDMTHIKAEAFTAHTRPAAVFVHDAHNEKAGIEDCAACHHGKNEQGQQDKEDISAGTPCADCHAPAQDKGTPLMRAYHQQCINCHTKEDKGPTHCAGCHVEK